MPVDSLSSSSRQVAFRSETVLAVALVVGALAFAWARSVQTPAVDFFTKWSVAREIAASGGANAYSAEERRRIGSDLAREFHSPATLERHKVATAVVLSENRGEMEVAASPFLYASMVVFGLSDYETSYLLFALVSLLSLVAAILLLCRHLLVPFHWTLVLLAVVAAQFEPLSSDVRVGNINQLHLAAVVAASLLVSPGRRHLASFAAGTLLGFAAALKPNVLLVPVLLFVGLWLDGRRTSAAAFLAGLLGSAAAAFASAAAFFGGWKCWLAWRDVLPSLLTARYGVAQGNFGLAALVHQAVGVDASALLLLLLLLLLAWALWRSRRYPAGTPAGSESGRDGLLLAGLGCVFMILSGPYVWMHYFVLALPLGAYVFFKPDLGLPRVAGFVAFGLLLVSTTLVRSVAPEAVVLQAVFLDLSVLVIAGLGLRALARGERLAPAGP